MGKKTQTMIFLAVRLTSPWRNALFGLVRRHLQDEKNADRLLFNCSRFYSLFIKRR